MPPLINHNSFIFKSNDLIEMNDVVYPGPAFELTGHSYKIIITPKTDFWRFGLRLAKTRAIHFDARSRHNNSESKDIQFAVGDVASPGAWQNPNKIHFGQYHLEGPHELS